MAQLPPDAAEREAARERILLYDTRVKDAIQDLREQFSLAGRHIGAVLVTEGGRLTGIFTERDMVNRVIAAGRDPDGTVLAEVMTGNPRTVEGDTPAVAALRVMQNGQFRHLPVMRDGYLTGILSLRDFGSSEYAEMEREHEFEQAIAEGGRAAD